MLAQQQQHRKSIPQNDECPKLAATTEYLSRYSLGKRSNKKIAFRDQCIYVCLACGKYFQGRRTNTHAYTNSIAGSHCVFLNLHALNFYCLPDNYEIIDSSLDDMKFVLNPTFYRAVSEQSDTNENYQELLMVQCTHLMLLALTISKKMTTSMWFYKHCLMSHNYVIISSELTSIPK
ncbi:hypothetical protein TKK_0005938 [Trichogramma kaykai]